MPQLYLLSLAERGSINGLCGSRRRSLWNNLNKPFVWPYLHWIQPPTTSGGSLRPRSNAQLRLPILRLGCCLAAILKIAPGQNGVCEVDVGIPSQRSNAESFFFALQVSKLKKKSQVPVCITKKSFLFCSTAAWIPCDILLDSSLPQYLPQ